MNVTDLEWYKSNSPSWKNPDLKGLDTLSASITSAPASIY